MRIISFLLIVVFCQCVLQFAQSDTPEPSFVRYSFNVEDENKDGTLSYAEWRPDLDWFEENNSAEVFAKLENGTKAKFEALDVDGNGVLNFQELVAEYRETMRLRFVDHDLNGDGILLIDEYAESVIASPTGAAIHIAALEVSHLNEGLSGDPFIARIYEQVAEWGQPEDIETAILTPAFSLRLGEQFAGFDLNSDRRVTLQEYTDVQLGIYDKSDAAKAREDAAEQDVESSEQSE
ncbi:MAG: hypothetical protein AAGG45_05175 [Pseudomonadota bacterium]